MEAGRQWADIFKVIQEFKQTTVNQKSYIQQNKDEIKISPTTTKKGEEFIDRKFAL